MTATEDTQKLIINYTRRLQKLKETQSLYGISTPPQVTIEIEDIESKLVELQTELEADQSALNRQSARGLPVAEALAQVQQHLAEVKTLLADRNAGGVNIGNVYGGISGNIAGRDINQSPITAGPGSVIGSTAGGDIVTGSNVNIGSTLTNVTQQVGALPQAGPDDRAELEKLLKQLEAELKKLPADKQEDAETVTELTQDLVAEANKEKPKQGKLQITGEGLKEAAENLAGIAPQIGEIAGKIIIKILTPGG